MIQTEFGPRVLCTVGFPMAILCTTTWAAHLSIYLREENGMYLLIYCKDNVFTVKGL
jgi:hypothetical protein